eukprot:scaffold8181_cov116-Isochrysis_galbana.AAC.2
MLSLDLRVSVWWPPPAGVVGLFLLLPAASTSTAMGVPFLFVTTAAAVGPSAVGVAFCAFGLRFAFCAAETGGGGGSVAGAGGTAALTDRRVGARGGATNT